MNQPTSNDLTVLGASVKGPIEHVESFPAPAGCVKVKFTTDEVNSLCPVTGQPDISSVLITYLPRLRCVESKSLKLYLWSFRDKQVFAEALAVEIAEEIRAAISPAWIQVVVTQHPRGGIVIETTSEFDDR
ncbi:MAG: preQ(1) synthase [Jatrophihabitantaceae bacterium]